MIPLATLRELFNYNYWARDRQLAACAAPSNEQFLRPMGNSFSSLRDTLAHLVAAEWIWLERWRGRSPSRADAEAFAGERLPTLAAIEERWRTVEREVRQYLADLKDLDISPVADALSCGESPDLSSRAGDDVIASTRRAAGAD